MLPLPPGPFDLILADPPWLYTFGRSSRSHPSHHYDCLTTEAIAALPIAALAAPNAVLVLWATAGTLDRALTVLQRWGFTFKSSAVWEKPGLGMGCYWRQNHEIILLGTRGKGLGAPPPSARPPSVIHAPKRGHSVKPDVLLDQLESMWPAARRLELFARRNERPDRWTVWGDEAPD